jgi:hypothetical protein
LGQVSVFFNNHEYLGISHDIVVIVGERPAERFQERFGDAFESLGFRLEKFPDWEAFRTVYCRWADDWEAYKNVSLFKTLVLFPFHEIDLMKTTLTARKYSW